eukprot:13791943-Ditylum_brightwellii.AAC.1
MHHYAKHSRNTVMKELYIACCTSRRPDIVKPDSNLKFKSSNIIVAVHNIPPDPTYTESGDQEDEADNDQCLSSYEHISTYKHQSGEDKIPSPAMKGAVSPSQPHEHMSHSFINSFQDFNQFIV